MVTLDEIRARLVELTVELAANENLPDGAAPTNVWETQMAITLALANGIGAMKAYAAIEELFMLAELREAIDAFERFGIEKDSLGGPEGTS